MQERGVQPERASAFQAVFADEGTFRAWYDRALPTVFGFIYARCGGVRHLAEELTQETFVQAVRDRARFDGRSDPVTWLCAIASHKLADHWRRLHREERRHLKLLQEHRAEEPEERIFAGAEDREAVLRTLRALPARQQAVLVLHYLDGQPIAEIARTIGASDSAVESLLARAREGFRRASAPREDRGDDPDA